MKGMKILLSGSLELDGEERENKQANNSTDQSMSDSEKCITLGVCPSSYSPRDFLPQNPVTHSLTAPLAHHRELPKGRRHCPQNPVFTWHSSDGQELPLEWRNLMTENGVGVGLRALLKMARKNLWGWRE